MNFIVVNTVNFQIGSLTRRLLHCFNMSLHMLPALASKRKIKTGNIHQNVRNAIFHSKHRLLIMKPHAVEDYIRCKNYRRLQDMADLMGIISYSMRFKRGNIILLSNISIPFVSNLYEISRN